MKFQEILFTVTSKVGITRHIYPAKGKCYRENENFTEDMNRSA